MLVEAKLGAGKGAPDPAIRYFAERLGVQHKFVVCADLDRPAAAGDIRILDAASFFASLPI